MGCNAFDFLYNLKVLSGAWGVENFAVVADVAIFVSSVDFNWLDYQVIMNGQFYIRHEFKNMQSVIYKISLWFLLVCWIIGWWLQTEFMSLITFLIYQQP